MNYRYDAFGNLFTDMPAPYNATGYTGKTYDLVAGLMDYSARWYSPTVGRFLTEDSYIGNLNNPQSLNRYSYVMNNPVNMVEPSGHAAIDHQNGGGGTGDNGSSYGGAPDWVGPYGQTDQLPNWVLNQEDHSLSYDQGDTLYLESWYFNSYSKSESDTWLADTIKTEIWPQLYWLI